MLEMTGLKAVGECPGAGPLGMKGMLPGMKGTPKEGAAAAGAPAQKGIMPNGAKPVDSVEKLPQLWPGTPHLLQQPVSILSSAPGPVTVKACTPDTMYTAAAPLAMTL